MSETGKSAARKNRRNKGDVWNRRNAIQTVTVVYQFINSLLPSLFSALRLHSGSTFPYGASDEKRAQPNKAGLSEKDDKKRTETTGIPNARSIKNKQLKRNGIIGLRRVDGLFIRLQRRDLSCLRTNSVNLRDAINRRLYRKTHPQSSAQSIIKP